MEKIINIGILKTILNFRDNCILYDNKYYTYINLNYIKKNNLILRPVFKQVDGRFEFGYFYDLLVKNSIESFFILFLNTNNKMKKEDYIKKLVSEKNPKNNLNIEYFSKIKDEYVFFSEINHSNNIEVYYIKNSSKETFDKIFEKYISDEFILFTSLDFNFFILSTYFYYDLICGKKEIVNNFVKMTNKECIDKLKELDEVIEDPIRLYDIYGNYFKETEN